MKGLQKLVARQNEERGEESKVVVKGRDGMDGVIAGAQNLAAPSRVLRRDGERPFFGSGIYERVSKAKRVWMEREEGDGKAREMAQEYRQKTAAEPPRPVPSPKSPCPPSAVGDWGMAISQEIDQTMTETVDSSSSDDGECSTAEDSAAEEEEEEDEAEVDDGRESSTGIEAREML